MNFELSEEQVMLKDAITRFLREQYSFEDRRRLVLEGSSSPAIWKDIASFGILGAAVPEELGGMAGGPVETMVIMEALGQALVVEPYLETAVIGGGLLKRIEGERVHALLSAMVAGEVKFAFAAGEPTSRYNLTDISTVGRPDAGGWVIDGAKSVVYGAPDATHFIVTARTSGEQRDRAGVSLFLVEAGTAGITAHNYRLIDGRGAADLEFNGVRVAGDALLGIEGQSLPLIEQVMDEAIAAVCAEAVGGMRRMLEDTIEYTKQRRQFGQPLSSFQALQHRMVDMYMALEKAVSAVYLVTLKLDADPVERALAASAAKATIAQCARFIGQNAVQLHGGMGMTDELAVGHYFKRATMIEYELGSRDFHVARYAELSRKAAA